MIHHESTIVCYKRLSLPTVYAAELAYKRDSLALKWG